MQHYRNDAHHPLRLTSATYSRHCASVGKLKTSKNKNKPLLFT